MAVMPSFRIITVSLPTRVSVGVGGSSIRAILLGAILGTWFSWLRSAIEYNLRMYSELRGRILFSMHWDNDGNLYIV